MMRKPLLTLSLGALALGLAGAALAQPADGPRGDHPPMTRSDVAAHAAQMFAKLDANGDGKLDKADGDARASQSFDRLDSDGNGQLSREEFAAGRDKLRSMRGGPDADADHDMRQGRQMRGMGNGPPMAGMMLQMADTNKDGAISKDEFTAAALAHFDRMDSNKDGTISPDEMKSGAKRMPRPQAAPGQ